MKRPFLSKPAETLSKSRSKKMQEVLYGKEKLIPVVDSVDVLVVGGGPGGLGAAVMAGRNGCKTLLAERFGAMGGMAFHGEVNPFMYNHLEKKSLDRPVFIDWCEKMVQYYSPAELERVPFDAETFTPIECISRKFWLSASRPSL